MKTETVALFPIPELVTFPHTTVPLHVFEPRYRTMIKDCVKNNVKIGVSHIKEVIKEASRDQNKEEVLSSNQSTYTPQNIFSAGHCIIEDVTSDGRLKVKIDMIQRYQLDSFTQEVPYKVCECLPYDDESSEVDLNTEISTLRHKIDGFLLNHAYENEDKKFEEHLQSSEWKDLDHYKYSFKIFDKIRLQGDLAQQALEQKHTYRRLFLLSELLQLESHIDS